MALGSIQFGGLASGLPPDMVDQLMGAQEYRLKSLNRDKDFFTKQKSSFSELKSKLSSLSSKATALQDDSTFAPHTATSSDTDKLTVTADSTAVAGTHSVSVTRLASSNTLMTTSGVTSSADTLSALSANTFSFDYNGNNYTNADFGIAAGDTLATIASKIGSHEYDAGGTTEDGISASVLYDGTNYRLVLAAKDQGAQTRNADGTTAASRIENLSMDLAFDSGTAMNTTVGSAFSFTIGSTTTGSGIKSASDTVSNIATNLRFTYNGVTYDSDPATADTYFNLLVGDDLDAIATKINAIGAAGLQAQVINDGTNSVVAIEGSSTISGVAMSLDFTTAGAGAATAANSSGGYFQTAEGQDAKLTVDGLSNIYSSENTVSDVLPGVTMVVQEVTTSALTVTVANDTATLKETLNGFTKAYNDVVDYINNNKETTLRGESMARSVVSQMRSVLNTSTHKSDGSGSVLTPFSILAEMGLRTDQKTGKISFDGSSLDNALDTDFNALTALFTNTQTDVGVGNNAGLAYRFEDLIDNLTNSSSGALTGKSKGLDARIDRLKDSIERENLRLEKVREQLTLKFANLEQMVNSMNGASGSLLSTLSKM